MNMPPLLRSGRIAQSVEHSANNAAVQGSSPCMTKAVLPWQRTVRLPMWISVKCLSMVPIYLNKDLVKITTISAAEAKFDKLFCAESRLAVVVSVDSRARTVRSHALKCKCIYQTNVVEVAWKVGLRKVKIAITTDLSYTTVFPCVTILICFLDEHATLATQRSYSSVGRAQC